MAFVVRVLALMAAGLHVGAGPALATTEDTRPQTQNSPTLATPAAVEASQFSGAAAYQYRIELPPGTGGFTPELVIANSTTTGNTEYGYGWDLSLSYIERSGRFGAPDYASPSSGGDTYAHRFELDGDLLVKDPVDSSRFHKRFNDGSRVLYVGSSDHWEVTQPDGTKHLYGSRADSKLARTPVGSISTQTYRWSLDEVVDARGNAYRIDYVADLTALPASSSALSDFALHIYPKRIRYSYFYSPTNGEPVDPATTTPSAEHAARVVEFVWQSRGDPGSSAYNADPFDEGALVAPTADLPTSYRGGMRHQKRWRLEKIKVGESADDLLEPSEIVREYEFRYATKITLGASSLDDVFIPNSELVEIRRYGRNGSQFGTSTKFSYSRPVRSEFQPARTVAGTDGVAYIRMTGSSFYSSDVQSGLFDHNGDGFLDLSSGAGASLGGPQGFSGSWGNGVGTTRPHASDTDWDTPPHTNETYEYYSLRAETIDLDGDGMVDRLEVGDCDATNGAAVDWCWYQNDGLGLSSSWTPVPQAAPYGSRPGVDGDRLGDTVEIIGSGPETSSLFVDLNGDGLPDYLDGDDGPGLGRPFYRNNGNGFDAKSYWTGANGAGTVRVSSGAATADPSSVTALLDINGDGLPDVHNGRACLDGGQTYFNLGYGWQSNVSTGATGHEALQAGPCSRGSNWLTPESGTYDGTASAMLDMNGDGVLDIVAAGSFLIGGPPEEEYRESGPHWVVYYGLGDGRYLAADDVGAAAIPGLPVVGYGHHWAIPQHIRPEPFEPNAVPPPSGHYWIRYTYADGNVFEQSHIAVADTVDLTGDGLPDYVTLEESEQGQISWAVYEHPGHSGLLESVENELGGVTQLEYVAAAHAAYDGTEAGSAGSLSSPLAPPIDEPAAPGSAVVRFVPRGWLVKSIEASDGVGGSPPQTESFAYSQPRFDLSLRESAGHRLVETADAAGVLSRTLYHQQPSKRGGEQFSETLSSTSPRHIISSTATTWTATTAETFTGAPCLQPGAAGTTQIPGSVFLRPGTISERVYDTANSALGYSLDSILDFDCSTGELLSETRTDGATTKRTEYSYSPNESDWLVAYPYRVRTLFKDSPQQVDFANGPESTLTYDGQDNAVDPAKTWTDNSSREGG